MKIFINFVFLLMTYSSIAQTRYSSLNDACTKNANGSGVSNNSKSIYIANFSIVLHDYAFTNNESRNYKRLRSGFYYHAPSNTAFQTTIQGRISNIQACANNNQEGVFPNSPLDANYGIVGWVNYGTDYDAIKNELAGGTSTFNFYGNSNGQSYPTGSKNGNGYETMAFPTHSVTQKAEFEGLRSMCRIKITDSDGKVVFFCEDTRGGFHPTFGSNLRGNNHPDDANRYLREGNYTLEYSNITNHGTNMPQRLELWYQNNGFEYLIKEVVNNGETVVRGFNIFNTGSTPNVLFKLNNNVF